MNAAYISPPSLTLQSSNLVVAPTKTITRLFLEEAKAKFNVSLKQSGLIADSIPYYCSDQFALVGPVLGGAAVNVACLAFLNSGVNAITFLGTAGALHPNNTPSVSYGDLIFPRFSIDFGGNNQITLANSDSQTLFEQALRSTVETHRATINIIEGGIVTTGNPYSISLEDVSKYYELGNRGIEMEFSALVKNCTLFNSSLTSIFVVSDILGRVWEKGFSHQHTHNSLKLCATEFLKMF